VRGYPAIDPDDWLWIRLAFQPTPYLVQIDIRLSAYAFLDADGNLYKWGNDGSGAVAWGWDFEDQYDFNGSNERGLYDRYTYEVMYMRGAPTIQTIYMTAEIDKKVYADAGGTVTNPIDVKVFLPATVRSDSLDENIFSDLNSLKYVIIPYDTTDPNFNLDILSLTEAEFMALYTAAPSSLKGDLLASVLKSGATAQEISRTINAPINGRLIIYGDNERYASGNDGVTREYVNNDAIFLSLIVENIYTPVNVRHRGEGTDPSGVVEELYAPTNDYVRKTNNDSADTKLPFNQSLYGLPLDANGQIIGATKNADGTVTIVDPPRYGYDQVEVRSYEAAIYPAGNRILYYWRWMELIGGVTQPRIVNLAMTDVDYVGGYTHTFYYEPNQNWLSVSGTKEWNDYSDRYGFRPAQITLTLKQYQRSLINGTRGAYIKDIETIVVNAVAGNSWPFEFSSRYKSYEYTYAIEETAIPYYTTTISYPNLFISPNYTSEDFSGIIISNTFNLKPVVFFKVDTAGTVITASSAEFTFTNSTLGGKVLDASGNEQNSITLISSLTDGTIVLPIQRPGTYYLTETKAPLGFSLLTREIVVVVDSDGNTTATLGALALEAATLTEPQRSLFSAGFNITNKVVAELPRTGGQLGAMVLFIVSAMETVVVAYLLRIRKKRKEGI
jgi:hypothetical protein